MKKILLCCGLAFLTITQVYAVQIINQSDVSIFITGFRTSTLNRSNLIEAIEIFPLTEDSSAFWEYFECEFNGKSLEFDNLTENTKLTFYSDSTYERIDN